MSPETRKPLRQTVGNDCLHPRLAECAARLLVGKDRLQLHYLSGQRLNIVLRRVDDRQTLLQFGKVLMRRAGLFSHGLADAVRHAVEPFADRLVEFRLP